MRELTIALRNISMEGNRSLALESPPESEFVLLTGRNHTAGDGFYRIRH